MLVLQVSLPRQAINGRLYVSHRLPELLVSPQLKIELVIHSVFYCKIFAVDSVEEATVDERDWPGEAGLLNKQLLDNLLLQFFDRLEAYRALHVGNLLDRRNRFLNSLQVCTRLTTFLTP